MKKLMRRLLLITTLLSVLPCDIAHAWGPIVTLIEPTTAAVTKEVSIPEGLGSSLQLTGALGAGESITLQRWNGTAWEQLKVDGADAKSLTSTNHIITMYGAMGIRINKPVTAAAAGVDWRR